MNSFNRKEMEKLDLSNGHKMPAVGLGTSIFPEAPANIEPAIDSALAIGYRHIDTAYFYRVESNIGNALKKWIDTGRVEREDLFIVTKLPQIGMTPEKVNHFLKQSCANLQLDYIDLYLCHWPVGLLYESDANILPKEEDGTFKIDPSTDIIAVWKEMENQVDLKLCRSIGLSNFNEDQIERIMKIARHPPVVNQVEVHAYFQQKKLREACAKHKIVLTAYYPIGGLSRQHYPDEWKTPFPKLLEDETVLELSKKYGKSPAQILLRFLVQLNISIVPKSTNRKRQKENFSICDFKISDEDLEKLATLDKGEQGRSCFGLDGVEKHPEFPF